MKQQKDSSNIIAGYKSNPKFQEDQLSKILNLDSYYSYLSVVLSYSDDHILIDKILPFVMRELSKVFPFVIIRSVSLLHVEIVFVSVNSLYTVVSKLCTISENLNRIYPGAILK